MQIQIFVNFRFWTKMTTRSQKRKAVLELVPREFEIQEI